MVHGAFENTSLLSCSIFPQLAAGAGIPAPKKLKDASEMIACAKMKEACTVSGEITPGQKIP